MVRRKQTSHPPRLAIALLGFFAGRQERAVIIGDLAEIFGDMALDQGGNPASRWFWNQALRSAGPLLISRLTSDRVVRSAGAIIVGIVTAIASATIFGGVLEQTLDRNSQATLGMLAMVTTACALVSSTCAGYVSTRVSGDHYRWAFVFIGFVVVAPHIVYSVQYRSAEDLTWLLLPLSLAIFATSVGLLLGRRLCHLIYIHSYPSGGNP